RHKNELQAVPAFDDIVVGLDPQHAEAQPLYPSVLLDGCNIRPRCLLTVLYAHERVKLRRSGAIREVLKRWCALCVKIKSRIQLLRDLRDRLRRRIFRCNRPSVCDDGAFGSSDCTTPTYTQITS